MDNGNEVYLRTIVVDGVDIAAILIIQIQSIPII